MTRQLAASQFYTGLVAELYEPLVSYRARAEDYLPFLERAGTPALELGCGSGHPLLDFVRMGFEVDGLDASADMLARCRAEADAEGLQVDLHEGEMQGFEIPRKYRAIFLVGGTFTLLASDADAGEALERMIFHLEPGGNVLIPLELPNPDALAASVGVIREATDEEGRTIRVGVTATEIDEANQRYKSDLRYERIERDGSVETVNRPFWRRWWTQDQFRSFLLEAGFEQVRMRSLGGGAASPDEPLFIARAIRPFR